MLNSRNLNGVIWRIYFLVKSPTFLEKKVGTTMYDTNLTDSQWNVIKHFFRKQSGRGRKRSITYRALIDAILYVCHTGCQWRQLPKDHFPKWKTAYNYFNTWSSRGFWRLICKALRIEARIKAKRMGDPSVAIIDAQSVKTKRAKKIVAYDGHKKVKGRKRNIAVDTQGNLLAVYLSKANTFDGVAGKSLIRQLRAQCPFTQVIVADQGYRGQFCEAAANLGFVVKIVERLGTSFKILPVRWVVERSIAWINMNRRLDHDYEVSIHTSTSWIYIAEIKRLLKKFK